MKKDRHYPNEGFIEDMLDKNFCGKRMSKQEIEARFRDEKERGNYLRNADRVYRKGDDIWIIEAKGETSQIGLDFRTGLGQLLHKMGEKRNPKIKYALAFPNEVRFHNQAKMVAQRIRKALNLHFIVVDENGDVRVIEPEEDLF